MVLRALPSIVVLRALYKIVVLRALYYSYTIVWTCWLNAARDIHQDSSSDQDEATFFNTSRLVYKYAHPYWFEGWCLFAFQDLTTQQQSGLRWDLKNVVVLAEHQAAHSSPELNLQPQVVVHNHRRHLFGCLVHVIHPSYLILGLRQNAGAIISWPSSLTLWIVYLPFIPKSLSQI